MLFRTVCRRSSTILIGRWIKIGTASVRQVACLPPSPPLRRTQASRPVHAHARTHPHQFCARQRDRQRARPNPASLQAPFQPRPHRGLFELARSRGEYQFLTLFEFVPVPPVHNRPDMSRTRVSV
ncbi:hypothetical protein M8J76_003552 [Diaphorina citri]|nr:hypothetical protein M8J76_003552 [Diaphorina citri]